MDLDELRSSDAIVFESIAGSHAYGLNTPSSDQDIRGLFIAPMSLYFGFQKIEQISDVKGDIVFFELQKFLGLLLKNNPNALEMLYVPADCVIATSPLFERIRQTPL